MRLKPFNSDKELKKVKRKYTKKQLLTTLLVLVGMVTIGTSYAIFSIQPEYHTFVKSQVGEFSTGDIKLFVTIDGEKRDKFPAKDSGYIYDKVMCENGGTGTWDSSNWQIKLTVAGPDECTINFEKYVAPASEYVESLLASNPETMNNDDPDGNVRYMGANPNNYVSFNNELWRIIGVFDVKSSASGQAEKRVKLIRADSLGNYSWDSSTSGVNDGTGVNEWSQADIMTTLNNGAYWNRTSGTCYNGSNNNTTSCNFSSNGLTSDAKNLIENAVWNTGTVDGSTNTYINTNAITFYTSERSNNTGKKCSSGTYCNDTVERTTTWIGQVGLMYPSDYGYATSGGSTTNRQACLNKELNNWDSVSDCYQNDWLYNSSTHQWMLTRVPYSSYSSIVFYVNSSGIVGHYGACNAYGVRPVVYLKSTVKITDGEGTSANPYLLT